MAAELKRRGYPIGSPRDHYGWLTTVAKSGQPVPQLVWFYFDGTDLIVYTEPSAAKVRHIKAHPQVSLNLDSDGNGGGIIVVGGTAAVDSRGRRSSATTRRTGRSTATCRSSNSA